MGVLDCPMVIYQIESLLLKPGKKLLHEDIEQEDRLRKHRKTLYWPSKHRLTITEVPLEHLEHP